MQPQQINQFSLSIATINGSGSQAANTVLAKALFRMGLRVGVQNLFPSNIAGLPTWFSIRVHPEGYTSRRLRHEIVIAKNAETVEQDLASVTSGGFFFYSQEFKNPPLHVRPDVKCVALPYRELTESTTASVKMRKLLTNMVYVGVLAELLKIDFEILHNVIRDQFAAKEAVIEANLAVVEAGRGYARGELASLNLNLGVKSLLRDGAAATAGQILIDGNSAGALGAVVGGCTVLAWYPITPSTSLAESFENFASTLRQQDGTAKRYAVLQAEDELSAIGMVLGAGWAGARALTATSGPGLSLMAEAAGLSYYAEIPAVVWDVQRAGPSTGLPTRTLQGDLQSAAHLSHGDTEHIVLIPGTTAECFEMGREAFDFAEEFQTLVIVLSDLDLGMNLHVTEEFAVPNESYRRGKVLDAHALNEVEEFARYRDVDDDGICYRTLPGTMHAHAAYFTRGTGHNENAAYSEDGEIFAANLNRLKKKLALAATRLPQPILQPAKTPARTALLVYGSTAAVTSEVQAELANHGAAVDVIRVRALPLHPNLESLLVAYEQVLVVEQNRDGQMKRLMTQRFPVCAARLHSILSYDGLPLSAELVVQKTLPWLAMAEAETSADSAPASSFGRKLEDSP